MHLHIMTPHGEDVVCGAHVVIGRRAAMPGDVPVEHQDGGDCTRCFVCESLAVAGQTGDTRDDRGQPGDIGKAPWQFGRYQTAMAVACVVGVDAAARLLVLRGRIHDGEVTV